METQKLDFSGFEKMKPNNFFKLKTGKPKDVTILSYKFIEDQFVEKDKDGVATGINKFPAMECEVESESDSETKKGKMEKTTWKISSRMLATRIGELLKAKGSLPMTINVVKYGEKFDTEYEATIVEDMRVK